MYVRHFTAKSFSVPTNSGHAQTAPLSTWQILWQQLLPSPLNGTSITTSNLLTQHKHHGSPIPSMPQHTHQHTASDCYCTLLPSLNPLLCHYLYKLMCNAFDAHAPTISSTCICQSRCVTVAAQMRATLLPVMLTTNHSTAMRQLKKFSFFQPATHTLSIKKRNKCIYAH
jgi:hypothetical protein